MDTHTRLRLPTIIMTKFQLVIFSLADNLLAGWSEKDDVFILCCVAALDVTERGVWVHNPRVTKCHQVPNPSEQQDNSILILGVIKEIVSTLIMQI